MGKSISKPVTDLTKQCITMSEGDFTTDMNEKYAKDDEVGELTRGFKKINENVSNYKMLFQNQKRGQCNYCTESMSKLNNEIQVMSSITQELSAKIEETSAMTEEINATQQRLKSHRYNCK